MSQDERKPAGPPPRNAWDSTLDRMEGAEPTQAGGPDEEDDDARHRDAMGIDGETGMGGYGGDAGEAGHDEAVAQPDKPLDVEIHGDPRTRQDEFVPDDAMEGDDTALPADEMDDEDEDDEEDDEDAEDDEADDQ